MRRRGRPVDATGDGASTGDRHDRLRRPAHRNGPDRRRRHRLHALLVVDAGRHQPGTVSGDRRRLRGAGRKSAAERRRRGRRDGPRHAVARHGQRCRRVEDLQGPRPRDVGRHAGEFEQAGRAVHRSDDRAVTALEPKGHRCVPAGIGGPTQAGLDVRGTANRHGDGRAALCRNGSRRRLGRMRRRRRGVEVGAERAVPVDLQRGRTCRRRRSRVVRPCVVQLPRRAGCVRRRRDEVAAVVVRVVAAVRRGD